MVYVFICTQAPFDSNSNNKYLFEINTFKNHYNKLSQLTNSLI